MDKFYENALIKIKKFYEINPKQDKDIQKHIFAVLEELISFKFGCIYYFNGEEKTPVYSYKSDKDFRHCIYEHLTINNLPFGLLEIKREKEFSKEEITVFKTCAAIISNIIKEAEINSIVKSQLLALQEGISSQNHAYTRIVEAEKAKNQFLANVSHELRSPLNSILGFTELLNAQFTGTLNEKQLEYVQDIRIAGLNLLNMVNEILDMSKIESKTLRLNLTKFQLGRNIQEVLNILAPLYAKKKQQVEINVNSNIEITADYQKLQQILFNLLSNAIKFTPDKGMINISALKTNKYISISVKDNGCGIDKKFHKKIFNKFEQITETPNSTGLGLTITSELVKLHGGKISLKSIPEQGSEFIVKIPVM